VNRPVFRGAKGEGTKNGSVGEGSRQDCGSLGCCVEKEGKGSVARRSDVASHMAPISKEQITCQGKDHWLFWPCEQQRTSFYALLHTVSRQRGAVAQHCPCLFCWINRAEKGAVVCCVQSPLETCFTKEAMITVCSLLTLLLGSFDSRDISGVGYLK
jgi:hypothetical protein